MRVMEMDPGLRRDDVTAKRTAPPDLRLNARMTLTPCRQLLAVMLPCFLVVIEDAWIAAIPTAITRIGLDWRSRRRIIAQPWVVGSRNIVVHKQTRSDTINMVARPHPSSPLCQTATTQYLEHA
ncbi:hypothetical protein GCM10011408_29290 [Dyella caseinilytica]|nr:hypothetical protein GCM10011408_29290 [Dyella caseinilytica]